MKSYSIMYRKLQRKPIVEDFTDDDWETYKYHLSYLLMCAAIAEMEKSLNYKSWGLEPPNAPPGPEEEYEGSFTDSHSTNKTELSGDEEILQEDSDYTIDREVEIRKIEKEVIKEFGYDALSEVQMVNLNLGLGIKFTKESRTIEEEQEDEIMDEESELEDICKESKNKENLSKDFDRQKKVNVHFKKKVNVSDIEEEELLEKPEKSQESLTKLITEDEMSKDEDIITNDSEEDGFIKGNDDETSDETEEEANADADHKRLNALEKKLRLKIKSKKPDTTLTAKTEVKKTKSLTGKKSNLAGLTSILTSPGKNVTDVEKEETDSITDSEDDANALRAEENEVYRGGDPALFLKQREPPPPYVRKRFLAFAKIQWRRILKDTIDDIVVLIECMNIRRSVRPRDNIKNATRMKNCPE